VLALLYLCATRPNICDNYQALLIVTNIWQKLNIAERKVTLIVTNFWLLTLLFLGAVGLHRTWDLRGYTADGLALLTGRKRAYGFLPSCHVLTRIQPVEKSLQPPP
jgi:hypothetical protein